jgi:ABC-type uncharacterized transport system substrate-binding protein
MGDLPIKEGNPDGCPIMKVPWLKAGLCGLALLGIPAALLQAKVVVVMSAELGPYQEALTGAKEVLAEPPEVVVLKDGKAAVGDASVVVALGGQAALAEYPPGIALVYAMVPDPKVKPSGHSKVCRIGMLPDAMNLFAKIKAIQPELSSLAALGVGDSYDAYLKDLAAAATAGGVHLVVKRVNKVPDLVAALRSIKESAQGFWVPPDTMLMNPEAFKLMTDFALGSKLALYAPATSLAKMGALAGIAPSFKEVGRCAAAAANTFSQGQNPGPSLSPKKSDVAINAGTAKALGLSPSAVAASSLP